MWKPAALCLLALLTCSPAAASTDELLNEMTRALDLSSPKIGAKQRLEFAAAGLAYWQDFDLRIPRNSPADEKWLQVEIGTRDPERVSRALSTTQYALSQLVSISENCTEHHRVLLDYVGVDKAAELYLWLKAVACYSGEEPIGLLRDAGLSDGTYSGAFKMQAFGIYASQISGRMANSIWSED